jgi:hypothetical protein
MMVSPRSYERKYLNGEKGTSLVARVATFRKAILRSSLHKRLRLWHALKFSILHGVGNSEIRPFTPESKPKSASDYFACSGIVRNVLEWILETRAGKPAL